MNFVFAFDGPDASGKTLITSLVVEDLRIKLKDSEFVIRADKMPGATPVGAEIRKILKNPSLKLGRMTERLLFAADTAEYFKKINDDDLDGGPQEGHTIRIVDRWSPITEFMYSIPRGVTPEELTAVRVTYSHLYFAKPNILFLVDVAWHDVLARLHAETRPACRIEKLGDDFQGEVWGLYASAARAAESASYEHCVRLAERVHRLDNTQPEKRTVRQVADEAIRVIEQYIAERT